LTLALLSINQNKNHRKMVFLFSMYVKVKIKDVVYAQVKAKILSGEYTYADKILDVEIAKTMNVSRMPVREALLQLETEGYLVITSRGFELKKFSPQEIEHIFDIRLLLEPYAARIVSQGDNERLVADLEPLLEEAKAAIDKGDYLGTMDANRKFRSRWLSTVPNPRLVETINRLQNHAETVRLATLKSHGARVASLEFNRKIRDAFAQRRPHEAEELARLNLLDSLKFYREIGNRDSEA
jgi:DNA-binding GntR family transcriptional regulator